MPVRGSTEQDQREGMAGRDPEMWKASVIGLWRSRQWWEEADEEGRAVIMKSPESTKMVEKGAEQFPALNIARDSGRLNVSVGSGLFICLYKHNRQQCVNPL